MLAARTRAGAIVPFGAGTPPAYRFPGVAHDDALLAAAVEAGCDAAFVPGRPPPRRRAAGRDGHGFDADHDRVHRRDRRHAGDQARGRRDHRERDARRDRVRGEPAPPRGAARGPAGRGARTRLRRAAAAVAGRRADAGRIHGGRREDGAALRRIHVLHRPPQGAPRARLHDFQHARHRRRQADRAHRRAHRRRRGEGGDAAAPEA